MKRILLVIVMLLISASLACAADLKFGWTQASEDLADLSHWTLYSSEAAGGPYTLVTTIPYGGEGVTDYVSEVSFSVEAGTDKTYYFVLTASDTSGNESGYSNEASKGIDAKPPGVPQTVTVEIVIK